MPHCTHLGGLHHLLQLRVAHGGARGLQALPLRRLDGVAQPGVGAQLHRHAVPVVQQVLADQGACVGLVRG